MNGSSRATLFRAILWLALTLPAAVHSAAREIDDELREKLKATISQATSFSDRYEAEVWLVQKSTVLARFIDSPQERLRILKEVHKAAKQVGLPPEFVLAVIHIESAFDPYAVSRVGAQGMMQVMPFWKKEIGRESDNLIKLETNLKYGCTILKYYLDKENGHWADALARYNGSYGRYTYSHKVINVWTKYWR
ncbi:lytic transglycosylase domain-containing protein [Teredinibacter turnerae]|uniref:Lytic transglycosylase n=1 Tax=Teredinibacter turnerae (strain ATCC 39867 / T7901) TaxID=377629 RepID=C5BPN8_TERTT|nr:lytic transglycosylase domain-containing protein [Teredinibacter turnerae]ACR14738.1 lytic transglycosylase [Teredinibacter turnerae T7901]